MIETKVCKTCQLEKPLSCFSQAKKTKHYHPHCKPCDAARAKRMRAENKAKGFCSCGRAKAPGDEFRCEWCRAWRTRSNNERSKKRSAKWRAKNIGKIKQQHRDKKLYVLMEYGGLQCQCAGCDVTDQEFLTIDHIGGGGRKHRKEVGHLYDWLIKNNFPPGFRVLCMNCNFAHGKFGYCPHERDLEMARVQDSLTICLPHIETIKTINLNRTILRSERGYSSNV